MNTLPQPHSACIHHALYRHTPEDFRVEEILGFAPTGEGEHLLLHIEKRGANTGYIATELAKWAGIASKHVGYCGLKDRHAVTRQWFSLWLPQRKAPTTPFAHSEATVLETTWHQRKLPTGAHQGNRFRIGLRQLVPASNWNAIEQSLESIATHGAPNYFGAQRFGHNGSNLDRARALFSGTLRIKKRQQSMLFSAARAAIFNRILAQRVTRKTWNTPLPDDIFSLNANNSIFTPEAGITPTIQQRCAEGDIHPTGALWGKQPSKAHPIPAAEQQVADSLSVLSQGLEQAGLKMARRSLRLLPQNLQWQADPSAATLTLVFTLHKGCYATSLLAALGKLHEHSNTATQK